VRYKGLLLSVILGAGFGCGEQGERPLALPLDRVPAQVKDSAIKALPQVKFDSAWKSTYHGQPVYEVRGKDKSGKIREVEVTPDGKVLEIE
jgi:hypothetical protein